MREAFAHDAVLAMSPGADEHVPGAAITVALCGSWQHEPPCPLAPHHTRVQREGGTVTLRLLFAAEPEEEQRVRDLVDAALGRGWADSPDGARTPWTVLSSGRSEVRPEEEEHAQRLVRG